MTKSLKTNKSQKGTFTKKQLKEFLRLTKKYDKLKRPHYKAIEKLMKKEYEEMMRI